ncbi:MAG: M23 family metallopeptidase [Bacteroidales bacterium]|nr:M23 family metallopeptidase [Bacteroidales bacterium]
MNNQKEKKKYIEKLKNKYRLVIFNDSTFAEVFSFRLSRLNVFAYFGIFIIIFIVTITILIAFTPLREYIPGYPDGNMRRNIIHNAIKVDSLENELRIRDQYLANLKNIIYGYKPKKHELQDDSVGNYKNIKFFKSKEDSLLRQQIDMEEQYNFSLFNDIKNNSNISNLNFYTPLKGLITNKFNLSESHYGIDIVASANENVAAILSGTIIISTWTLKTGNIIQIQHKNDLISVYKHNSELLKPVGSKVEAGEIIAVIGNTGELTTGPHLHFELWHKGIPVNPENYISF